MTLFALVNYIFIAYPTQNEQPFFIVIVSLLIGLSYFYVGALLIYALHATFLSSGKRQGIAVLNDLASINRIAWRSILITIAAAILSLAVFIFISLFGSKILNNMIDSNAETNSINQAEVLLVFGFSFVIALVFFGLRIPHIVFRGSSEKDRRLLSRAPED